MISQTLSDNFVAETSIPWAGHISLFEMIRKLFRPPIGAGMMVGIVLPYTFPTSACASHVPGAGKEEIGDVLCSW